MTPSTLEHVNITVSDPEKQQTCCVRYLTGTFAGLAMPRMAGRRIMSVQMTRIWRYMRKTVKINLPMTATIPVAGLIILAWWWTILMRLKPGFASPDLPPTHTRTTNPVDDFISMTATTSSLKLSAIRRWACNLKPNLSKLVSHTWHAFESTDDCFLFCWCSCKFDFFVV